MCADISPPYREPNGRQARTLQRHADRALARDLEGPSPAALRRAFDNNLLTAMNPIWGRPVGIMTAQGKLTFRQLVAARYWDQLSSAYRKAISAMAPDPKAAGIGDSGGRSTPADPDSDRGKVEAITHQSIVRAFEAALDHVRLADPKAESTLRACCEGSGRLAEGFDDLTRLQKALNAVDFVRNLTSGRSHVR